MEKNIIKFMIEQHNRLSCIIRYNNTPKITDESVAEHSYYVAFIAMLLADYLTTNYHLSINKETAIRMALLHDVEEVISGDILKVLKEGGFKVELERINEKSMRHLTGQLQSSQGEMYFDIWKEFKEEKSLEAKLVDVADLVAAVAYCIREIHLGNCYMREILEYIVRLVLKSSDQMPELKKFIRELADYALGYLLEDKSILEEINRAVRIKTL